MEKQIKPGRPSGSSRRHLVLNIVKTDNTFELKTLRDETCWVGKCLFCRSKLVVSLNGDTTATIEHILPLTHGGTNDLSNLALACVECNSEKGRRHDSGKKPVALIEQLLMTRQQRWKTV